jgi:ribosome biogenesis GTPase
VRAAIADNSLDPERLASWRKLEGELKHLALKQDARLRAEARKAYRRFARSQRKASW